MRVATTKAEQHQKPWVFVIVNSEEIGIQGWTIVRNDGDEEHTLPMSTISEASPDASANMKMSHRVVLFVSMLS